MKHSRPNSLILTIAFSIQFVLIGYHVLFAICNQDLLHFLMAVAIIIVTVLFFYWAIRLAPIINEYAEKEKELREKLRKEI